MDKSSLDLLQKIIDETPLPCVDNMKWGVVDHESSASPSKKRRRTEGKENKATNGGFAVSMLVKKLLEIRDTNQNIVDTLKNKKTPNYTVRKLIVDWMNNVVIPDLEKRFENYDVKNLIEK